MNQFKPAQVIMLPTPKESVILLNPTTNKLVLTKEIASKVYPIEEYIKLGFKPQHLYIISDDEIKEGDWVIHIGNPYFQFKESMRNLLCDDCKKIIATTNTSLNYETPFYGMDEDNNFPQPSQQFIEKYIESYNKSSVGSNNFTIIDVLVELDIQHLIDETNGEIVEYTDNTLKINPKNNTITIKKLKNNWNREEIVEFGEKIREYCKNGYKSDSLHKVFYEWDNWIKENL